MGGYHIWDFSEFMGAGCEKPILKKPIHRMELSHQTLTTTPHHAILVPQQYTELTQLWGVLNIQI